MKKSRKTGLLIFPGMWHTAGMKEVLDYIEASIHDRRQEWKVEHALKDIVAITLFATLANADDWVEVGIFAECNEALLRRYLPLKNGVPSHDTSLPARTDDDTELFARSVRGHFLGGEHALAPRRDVPGGQEPDPGEEVGGKPEHHAEMVAVNPEAAGPGQEAQPEEETLRPGVQLRAVRRQDHGAVTDGTRIKSWRCSKEGGKTTRQGTDNDQRTAHPGG